ncbi:uncharacterized protein [Panulirus ornatus]|uniref:uncharacterized protein isoform X2 n=1 Tax=Panulirus ornatus TaxID=150431 RepID=UPI003A8A4BCA
MKLLIQMVWVTVGTCLWWTLGSHGARVGTSGTTQSPWEARLSLLFKLPTTTTQAAEEVVHSGSLFSGATSVTPVADQSAKCRTLLNEGINCTSVSGEAVVASETVSNEAVDDESPDDNTTKNSDGRETVDTSRPDPSIVFDRAEGKRQFLGQGGVGFGDGEGSGGHALNQASVRPGGSNPGSGGVSSRITGSSPEAAVSMVQSFVEDMINRPDGGRPGYVMINSPNPAIIQQLVAALTQRYGSSSVVQDAGAIQDLTGSASGDSRIQTPNASSSAASSDMPVFPFESRWGGPSSEVPVDPEVDYIRQQLASIAHVSVSTGKLVNDTLVSPPATPKPADATVVPSLPIVTQITDDHTPTQGHANHNHQQPGIQTPLPTESIAFHSEELQDLNDEFSSQDTDLTPDGQSALNEGTGQQVEDVNDDIQHLLDDEGHEELYHSETSDTNSTTGDDYLTLPQDIQQEPEYMTRNLTDHRHTHLPPTDKTESVVISSLMWNASPPDVINRPTNNAVPVLDMNKHQTTEKVATETPTIIGVLGEDSTSGSPDTSKYDVDITPSAVDEGSTTGYEDYYEEIDGELVLSPTKFMRKGNPAVTFDYVNDEDYHETGGAGHQTGGDRPVLLQHSLPHQALTDWALAPNGVAESESASILRPHNPSLFPITPTGDVLEEDINEDPFPSQSTNLVSYNGNIPHEAADLQAYPNSHFHVNPRFPSNQNLGNDYMRQGLPPLYQNYDITPPRPSSADLEGYTDGPVQSGSGGSLPANPYLLEELWGMEKDSVRLSVLQELDRIPVVYEDEDLATSSTILRALLSSDALDHLARMGEGDLATLGLLDHVQAVGGSLHENGYMALHPVGEGSSPGADSSTQALVDKSRDQTTTSGGVSEELTPPLADGGQNVSEGELAQAPVRSSFSSGNYRQSDVNMAGQVVQPVPPDFFPRRPTEAPHPGSGHHHGSDPPQLTPEQQGIIARLPEGMRHVVSSIVLAVQAPSSLTPTSTTTSRPQHYPYPYPYPYPPYPYFPPPPPTYTYPYPPRPADFDGSSGSGHHHLTVHGAPELGHGILTDHGVLHGPHDGHGVPHGPHDGHGVPHGPHDGHGVPHGSHDGHGVLHGPHGGHGVLHGPHGGHGVPHGPHGGHGVLHGPHGGHGVLHGSHGGHGVHSSGVTGDNHGSHSAHGHHGTHGTQSGQIVPANHGNAEAMEAHHGHSSHRHGGHHGNHGSDREQNEDLRGGAAEDGVTATPSRLVTSTARRETPRPAVLTHSRSPGVSSPALPVVTSIPSLPPNYNPDAIGASRLGEFDATGLEDIIETGVRDNDNKRGSISRVGPSQPDRNQGLLNLRRDPAQMGHGRPSGGGFVSYRPQQQTNMHMGAPVVNVVLPEATTRVPAPAEKEIGPLIDPREDEDDEPVTKAPQTMNREQVNSLLQSLFSSPTLLLMGIVFAASAAYMAIAMEEQAAQQNFQQAQLAAAFGGQPFPPGRRRRRNLSSRRLWHPRHPQFVDLDH